ncbi:MAG: 3-hydroxyacyl-CoA dehydrogenase family protein [Candidatus Dormibacteraeota bacterium]|uniref:3-hydroxyacyl-CoA dehydrogenase family protein n=1 Tax=Candidatus Dormiibacter inghamiae TaxID=3127013 RepID=A0A934KEK5_9BACT|nr:3-hydroxyacyl-CoA dehydrogenase family protein [Candidatus Dormibacteraeota bacterium]MBJ7607032.1 3-hydroxyacyl-CoA dehydrogenase family protein [Candidatus Dormibacteraeota bacterium]
MSQRGGARLAVVGAGSMGAQIAQQAALSGLSVALQDISEDQLERARRSNRQLLERRVAKGRLDAAYLEAALGRVSLTTDLVQAASGADIVLEAVTERLEAKREIFGRLAAFSKPDAILASNSSTMGVSQLISADCRPERCCNLHFFYPPLVMDLVEVVKGPQTSDETIQRAIRFVRDIGRTPVLVKKEIPGFIVNRILHMATQEAYRLLDSGVASVEDIDTAVEKGLNWPLGPFRLGDLTGLDITYNARQHMYETTGDPRYKPSKQLAAKVAAGELGRKTQQGWYSYPIEVKQ